MVDKLYFTINTSFTNFTASKPPQFKFEILFTFEYQKLDRHLRVGLPVLDPISLLFCKQFLSTIKFAINQVFNFPWLDQVIYR